MLDFKNKQCDELNAQINNAGHYFYFVDNDPVISDEAAIQAIIDAFEMPMPNLLPVQWDFLLTINGFDDVIDLLLNNLKSEDAVKHAMYKSFLKSARFYEFNRVLIMFNEIREKFTAIDPRLDFTTDQLKQMWLAASEV